MSEPIINFKFSDDLWTCDIIISENGKSASFHDLRVKRVNLRDWQEPQLLYQVFIPCHKALGRDYMLLADRYSMRGMVHPEQAPIVFTAQQDDEIETKPKRKKGKKNEDQLPLL